LSTQKYGCGKRSHPKKKHYKNINKGLVAAMAPFVDNILDNKTFEEVNSIPNNDSFDLPPDIALAGHYNTDLKTINEALRGLNAKEWQEALDYKINQLEKLGTWEIFNLPQGHTAISCSKITCVKQGSLTTGLNSIKR
jgi:hypothetical protein